MANCQFPILKYLHFEGTKIASIEGLYKVDMPALELISLSKNLLTEWSTKSIAGRIYARLAGQDFLRSTSRTTKPPQWDGWQSFKPNGRWRCSASNQSSRLKISTTTIAVPSWRLLRHPAYVMVRRCRDNGQNPTGLIGEGFEEEVPRGSNLFMIDIIKNW